MLSILYQPTTRNVLTPKTSVWIPNQKQAKDGRLWTLHLPITNCDLHPDTMLASEKFWSNFEILQVFEITLQGAAVLFVFVLDCKVLTFFWESHFALYSLLFYQWYFLVLKELQFDLLMPNIFSTPNFHAWEICNSCSSDLSLV